MAQESGGTRGSVNSSAQLNQKNSRQNAAQTALAQAAARAALGTVPGIPRIPAAAKIQGKVALTANPTAAGKAAMGMIPGIPKLPNVTPGIPAAKPPAAPAGAGGGGIMNGADSSGSYGGGSGVDSSGGFGDPTASAVDSSAQVAAPTIPDVASDATYQAQIAELSKSMADYEAQNNLGKSQYDTNFNGGLRKIGWNGNGFDRGNMQGLYGQALNDNGNDFAGRGILRSGLYANADSDINNDFAERKTDMDTARNQFVDTQDMQLSGYRNQSALQKQAAQREAIARIAASQGVQLSQVPLGAV